MNGALAAFLDPGNTEWWPLAFGSLLTVFGGVILVLFKRHLTSRDEAQRLQRLADHEERKRVEAGIAGLGIQIAAEAEERRASDARESDIRREKDDALGRDLVKGLGAIREAFAYYCGKMDERKPRYEDDNQT